MAGPAPHCASFVREDRGSSPGVASYLDWNEGRWCDSVSSTRVNPALNGYLEKSGEGIPDVGVPPLFLFLSDK